MFIDRYVRQTFLSLYPLQISFAMRRAFGSTELKHLVWGNGVFCFLAIV
jgi:hypothetical protein